jgi:alkaline phosphatase
VRPQDRIEGARATTPRHWQKQHTGQSKETIRLPYVRVDDTHTGEEVLATGKGPGAELIHGYFPNTYLFRVMLEAYGWKEDGQSQ